ncbi:MAG: hypothetical protein JHD02_00390 [Thermoleophilaceae bacterium]|nr:hypothetical protein [Thermoleophilaceae bacterium]
MLEKNVCSYIANPLGRKNRTLVRGATLNEVTGQESLGQAVCARCGAAIDLSDHFHVRALDGEAGAFLCRTEHIVAWVMRGAHWQLERPWEVDAELRSATGGVQLRRARSGETIERSFASVDDLRAWASAGGFWSQG